ncbi:T-kininogen 1-like isoform X2 [Dendrobates tinctorius]|uniref:T-kininogen 1-like isoform X2 n=1 Tax=Dendrobates tinctorius TaxID=92724 RepID=UPI003CCA2770
MWFLPILLLFFHCHLSSATVIDADCNDQNVFSAVDAALRYFNDAKEDRNQLILYRTTDAKIKIEEDGHIHYFVEYEAQEGSCEVKTGKSWQECLPTYTHQAKCSAHVLINDDLNVRRVEAQNCSNPKAIVWSTVTAVEYPCLGCIHPIDKENKELLCFVHSTIEQINTDANYPFYLDFESIVNATHQVVYGWKYQIRFIIRQTNCSKSNFPSRNSKECKTDKSGECFECTAHVHVTPDGNVNYPFLECKSDTGVCINCPVVVDSEDPELWTLLVQVMDEYNVNSNHTELYGVSFVDSVMKKGFKGELYMVTFTIKATNCSKTDYSILGDECAFTHFSLAVRIGGLSPLRMSRKTNPIENDERSNPQRQHEHNNKGNKHGEKCKKGKNKHTFQDSSEENSKNEVTQAPLQQTIPATQKPGNLPTDIVPRCPGRVWYPSPITGNPTAKTFSNDDLLLAFGDSTPSSDQERKINEPLAPKQVLPFNDEDLLS